MIQLALTGAAVIFGTVKIVSTIWLARQPDAIHVTNTRFGRSIYLITIVSQRYWNKFSWLHES